MRCKVVGVQEQDFTLDNGYHFAGCKVHVLDLDKKPDGLTGHLTSTFKISKDSPYASTPILVGDIYSVFFEQDGRTIALISKEPVNVGK